MPTRNAAIGIFVLNGVRHQGAGESGYAHLLEHLLFKGTASKDVLELSLCFEAMGGQVNAYTGRELMVLHGFVPGQDIYDLVAVFSDMIRAPRFSVSDFEIERDVVLQEMAMIREDPEEAIAEEAVAHVWSGHPMSQPILGFEADVAGATAGMLRAYGQKTFCGGRIFVVAAGDVESAQLVAALAALAELDTGTIPIQAPPKFGSHSRPAARDVSQAHLLWVMPGIPVGDMLEPTFTIANHLLGGGASSCLFQEIRERRGLVYDIQSRLESYADVGLWFIETSCAPQHLDECRAATEETVAQMLDGRSLTKEMAVTRRFVQATVLLDDDDPKARVERLGRELVYLGFPETTSARLAAFEQVTNEAVRHCLSTAWEQRRLFEWTPEASDAR